MKTTDEIAAMQACYGQNFPWAIKDNTPTFEEVLPKQIEKWSALKKEPWSRRGFRLKRRQNRRMKPAGAWSFVVLPTGERVPVHWTIFKLGGKIAAPTHRTVVDKAAKRAWDAARDKFDEYLYLEEEPTFEEDVAFKKPRVWKVKECRFYGY